MHELSVCASIAQIARRRAGDRRVETIHLRIGQLRQIVPDTLTYCWSVLSADTELAGSELEVEHVPVRITCNECAGTSEVGDLPLFMCEQCGSGDVTIVAGEEFLVTSLDLAGGT
jgi:hydrogenase nickel incorporation protein HypA/HybF